MSTPTYEFRYCMVCRARTEHLIREPLLSGNRLSPAAPLCCNFKEHTVEARPPARRGPRGSDEEPGGSE